MKVNGYSVRGIFTELSDNADIIYESGDFIFDSENLLRKCVKESKWNIKDTKSFEYVNPNILSFTKWKNDPANSDGLVTSNLLRQILFGENNTNFLYSPADNYEGNISSYSGNIDDIDYSSTYFLDANKLKDVIDTKYQITDGILNTLRAGNKIVQTYYAFDQGNIVWMGIRSRLTNASFVTWVTLYSYSINRVSMSSLSVLSEQVSTLNKYLKENQIKYEIVNIDDSSEVYLKVDSYNPSVNFLIEIEYTINIDGGNKTCREWLNIFCQDIFDSENYKIVLHKDHNFTATLSSQKLSVKNSNDGPNTDPKINLIIKYNGEVSGDKDGTDIYEFSAG